MTMAQLGNSNACWCSLWPQTMPHLPGLENSVNLHLMGKIRRNLLRATIEFGWSQWFHWSEWDISCFEMLGQGPIRQIVDFWVSLQTRQIPSFLVGGLRTQERQYLRSWEWDPAINFLITLRPLQKRFKPTQPTEGHWIYPIWVVLCSITHTTYAQFFIHSQKHPHTPQTLIHICNQGRLNGYHHSSCKQLPSSPPRSWAV